MGCGCNKKTGKGKYTPKPTNAYTEAVKKSQPKPPPNKKVL